MINLILYYGTLCRCGGQVSDSLVRFRKEEEIEGERLHSTSALWRAQNVETMALFASLAPFFAHPTDTRWSSRISRSWFWWSWNLVMMAFHCTRSCHQGHSEWARLLRRIRACHSAVSVAIVWDVFSWEIASYGRRIRKTWSSSLWTLLLWERRARIEIDGNRIPLLGIVIRVFIFQAHKSAAYRNIKLYISVTKQEQMKWTNIYPITERAQHETVSERFVLWIDYPFRCHPARKYSFTKCHPHQVVPSYSLFWLQ